MPSRVHVHGASCKAMANRWRRCLYWCFCLRSRFCAGSWFRLFRMVADIVSPVTGENMEGHGCAWMDVESRLRGRLRGIASPCARPSNHLSCGGSGERRCVSPGSFSPEDLHSQWEGTVTCGALFSWLPGCCLPVPDTRVWRAFFPGSEVSLVSLCVTGAGGHSPAPFCPPTKCPNSFFVFVPAAPPPFPTLPQR